MGWEGRLRCVFGSITLWGLENDPRSGFHNTCQAILLRVDTQIIRRRLVEITDLDDPIVRGRLRKSQHL